MTALFETIFLPPGLFILLLLLSLILVKKLSVLKLLLSLQILLIYLFTIPLTSFFLFAALETFPALSLEQIKHTKADAIVVLAGGIQAYQKEYDGPDTGYFTHRRLRYGAWLQKQTGLPMIVTGGVEQGGISEAALMKQILQNEYGITTRIFIEQDSKNTYENSLYTRKILVQNNIQTFFLVTSAFHMPRALASFQQYNEGIIPAPMAFYHNRMNYSLGDFTPHKKMLWQNVQALHEIIGLYWYKIRYFLATSFIHDIFSN